MQLLHYHDWAMNIHGHAVGSCRYLVMFESLSRLRTTFYSPIDRHPSTAVAIYLDHVWLGRLLD